MKIALVGLTYPFRGGIAHYTTLMAKALGEKHEVAFFALKRQYPKLFFPGTTQQDVSGETLQTHCDACLDSINPLTWISAFLKIKKFKPDLLLFSWWHPFFALSFGTVALLVRCTGNIPVCYLCHNVFPHERSFLDRFLLRYAFFPAQAFVAHTQTNYEQLQSLKSKAVITKTPHPRYEVFAGNHSITTKQAKSRLQLEHRKVLLFFGYVRCYKGLHILLETMKSLYSDDDYHLLLVGEFYDNPKNYRSGLDILEARGQLSLIDTYVPNEDIPLYFQAADVVVAPYLSATQSGVIQLAYAFLKPVISTHVGGISELVREGKTGYLVQPGCSKSLATAIRKYFENPNRQQFKENILKEQSIYSWERLVKAIEKTCSTLSDSS